MPMQIMAESLWAINSSGRECARQIQNTRIENCALSVDLLPFKNERIVRLGVISVEYSPSERALNYAET